MGFAGGVFEEEEIFGGNKKKLPFFLFPWEYGMLGEGGSQTTLHPQNIRLFLSSSAESQGFSRQLVIIASYGQFGWPR